MGALRRAIEEAVGRDRFLVSRHARERLRQRAIPLWQVTSSLADGTLLKERTNDRPHPSVELRHNLPDGTDIKVVWSYDAREAEARLVTVHYFDR